MYSLQTAAEIGSLDQYLSFKCLYDFIFLDHYRKANWIMFRTFPETQEKWFIQSSLFMWRNIQ